MQKSQCFKVAGRVFAEGLLRMYGSEPRAAAEAAWIQGGPSVDEIEAQIREMQKQTKMKAVA